MPLHFNKNVLQYLRNNSLNNTQPVLELFALVLYTREHRHKGWVICVSKTGISKNIITMGQLSIYGWNIVISMPSIGPWFNIKMSSYQYSNSHCGDQTILRPSYLHNGISHTGKTPSLYWIKAQVCIAWPSNYIPPVSYGAWLLSHAIYTRFLHRSNHTKYHIRNAYFCHRSSKQLYGLERTQSVVWYN